MYEAVFAAPPSHISCPTAFRPGAGALMLQVAAPDGCTARLVVLTSQPLEESWVAARLSSAATGLALAPVRVFPVSRSSSGSEHAQAYGPEGSVVITFGSSWAGSIPAPPPAEGTVLEIEVRRLPMESGVLTVTAPIEASLKLKGRRVPGWLCATQAGVSFSPDQGVSRESSGVRATFAGVFVQSTDRWELRCDSTGVATGPGVRGGSWWVQAGGRVGLRLDVAETTSGGPQSPMASDATTTLASGTMVVGAADIVESVEDGTIILTRPND